MGRGGGRDRRWTRGTGRVRADLSRNRHDRHIASDKGLARSATKFVHATTSRASRHYSFLAHSLGAGSEGEGETDKSAGGDEEREDGWPGAEAGVGH
jgi:hypothetical protein